MISKFIDAALKGKDITLYGGGLQIRTFCYIDDSIETTTNALYQNKFVNDVVNIVSDFEMTSKDLAELIINVTASTSRIIQLPLLGWYDPSQAGYQENETAAVQKAYFCSGWCKKNNSRKKFISLISDK